MGNKLDPEFKAKWVAALRSGEYKQGKYNLLTEHHGACSFCCIGVAGMLRGISKEELSNKSNYDDPAYSKCLPELDRSILYVLGEMNDGSFNQVGAKSFSEIADYIEANL